MTHCMPSDIFGLDQGEELQPLHSACVCATNSRAMMEYAGRLPHLLQGLFRSEFPLRLKRHGMTCVPSTLNNRLCIRG